MSWSATPKEAEEVHHYHHMEKQEPHVIVKLIKNTKGYNWELSVSGDGLTTEEAMNMMDEANERMNAMYGGRE